MVVILILPTTSDKTSPNTTSTQVCDQFYLYGEQSNTNRKNHANHSKCTESNSIKHDSSAISHRRLATTEAKNEKQTTSKNNVRHVTRVNISDVYSQIEIDGDVEAVTKEGI